MIVYLANKTQFRVDILSTRIAEIVHESLQGQNSLNGTVKKSRIFQRFGGTAEYSSKPAKTFRGLPALKTPHWKTKRRLGKRTTVDVF